MPLDVLMVVCGAKLKRNPFGPQMGCRRAADGVCIFSAAKGLAPSGGNVYFTFEFLSGKAKAVWWEHCPRMVKSAP